MLVNSNFVYNVGDVITFTASDAPMLSGIITEAYQCVLGIPTGRKINASKYTINMNSAYIRTLSGLVQVTSGITMESVYQINKDTGNISLYLHFSSNVFASNLKNTPCIGMLIGKITFSN